MKRAIAVLLLICLAAWPASALAAEGDTVTGEELLYNADFSITSDFAALPAGWEYEMYADDETATGSILFDDEHGALIALEHFERNDSRACQTVTVKPNTVYRFTAMVKTFSVEGMRGANLSVDNYAIDGTYCYSPERSGTGEWEELQLYVMTGAEQTQLRVALRLGGYGSMATGEAWFTAPSLMECTAVGSGTVVDLMTENGAAASAAEEPVTAQPAGSAVFAAILAVTALGGALFAALYQKYLAGESLPALDGARGRQGLWALLTAALMFRVVLSVIFYGHSTDINCFMAWGNAMLSGPANFYSSGMFADYPPGYMYVLGALAWIGRLLGLSYGSTGYALLYKLPAIAADLVSVWLLYRLAKKNGISESFSLLLACLFALCPVILFVSGAWGQIDSILTLLVVLAFLAFQNDRRILAGAVYGLAILVKPQALMFGPLFAVAYIADCIGSGWKKRTLQTVLAVVAAFAVIGLLSLPFRGTQDALWIVGKYADTVGSYAYASIEAFNMPALLGGNWKSVTERVLGVTYKTWGTVAITLSVLAGGVCYWFGRKKSRGALFLTAAMMIALIFTFGHYMHERYLLPALLLLLVAYVFYRDRRILAAFGILSFATLLNVLAAMYIVDHQEMRGAFYNFLTRFGASLEVLGAVYLAVVTFRIAVLGRTRAPSVPKAAAAGAPGRGAAKSILPLTKTDTKLHLTKRDRCLLLGLILVYGVTAIVNLGTLSSPESYWDCSTAGESVTIEFDAETYVGEIWIHGNIRSGGMLLISAGDYETTYEQKNDEMFRWDVIEGGFTAKSVTVMLYSGSVCINELAFMDAEGDVIPVYAADPSVPGAALVDEQDTVPELPSYFNGMYFDELYHGRTAYEHLHNLKPFENSHPPLGKIFIMLGVAVFGMNPFGWRIVGALFGIGMLPFLYAFGKRMFKKTGITFVCTALFAFDFMHFTQTRIATIDVYGVFFIIAMFYYMYRYISMNFFVDDFKRTLVPLGLAGLFFGLGAASKWICFYAGGGLAVLFFGSLIARFLEYRRVLAHGTAAERHAVEGFWKKVVLTLLWCCVFYLAVPAVIYFLSYLPYFLYEAGQAEHYGLSDAWRTFWSYQEFMYSYHSGLTATHPYQSSWYQWPLTLRPMWYYFNYAAVDSGVVSTLTASGNPAVWWVGTFGAIALLVLRLLKKVEPDRALQILCVGVLANLLPWTLVTRCTFIYHFFATVPFLLLATAYLVSWLEDRDKSLAWVKWTWLAVGLLLFLLLYPGISGAPVSAEWASFLRNLPGGGLMYGA